MNTIKRNKTVSLRMIHDSITNSFKEEDIEQVAKELLQIFDVDLSKQVPIVAILNKLDIITFQKEMKPKNLSAFISIDPEYKQRYGSTRIACVNSLDNIGHKRFALAHELAHCIFDYDETKHIVYFNTYKAGETSNAQEEDRANYFAACLLMPREQFLAEYKKQLNNYDHSMPEAIASLADRFGVSSKAIQKRMVELKRME